MALALKHVPAARGAQWVRDAFRLYARRPLGFTGLFLVFLFAAMVVLFVPAIGYALQMALVPMLSLGFMVASAAARRGQPVQPGAFVEPLAGPRDRRRALLILCATYSLSALALIWLSDWLAGGQLVELQRLLGSGQARSDEIDALAADRGVFLGFITLVGGAAALSIPFWHAPALVWWGAQGPAQALFSSTLAVWRAKGAFVVYGLTWTGLIVGFALASALIFGLLGAPQIAGVLAIPVGLLFTTVFYVSLLGTFEDSFGGLATTDAPA